MSIEKLGKLKTKIEEIRSSADRAQGALDAIMKELEEEYECSSIEEARELLDKLKKKSAASQKEFDDLMVAFEEKWGDVLK